MQSLDDLPEIVTVEEYSAITRQGLTKAYDDVRLGRIEAVRLGRTIRIPRRAIEKLISCEAAKNGAGGRAIRKVDRAAGPETERVVRTAGTFR